jgi:hypothetical protein
MLETAPPPAHLSTTPAHSKQASGYIDRDAGKEKSKRRIGKQNNTERKQSSKQGKLALPQPWAKDGRSTARFPVAFSSCSIDVTKAKLNTHRVQKVGTKSRSRTTPYPRRAEASAPWKGRKERGQRTQSQPWAHDGQEHGHALRPKYTTEGAERFNASP